MKQMSGAQKMVLAELRRSPLSWINVAVCRRCLQGRQCIMLPSDIDWPFGDEVSTNLFNGLLRRGILQYARLTDEQVKEFNGRKEHLESDFECPTHGFVLADEWRKQ